MRDRPCRANPQGVHSSRFFLAGRRANHHTEIIVARAPSTPRVDLTPLPLGVSGTWTHRNEQKPGARRPPAFRRRAPHLGGLVGLDGDLDTDLVADDQAAVLQRTFEVHPEVTTVDLTGPSKPVTFTPGAMLARYRGTPVRTSRAW